MVDKFVEWSKQQHSSQKRLRLIVFLSIPFVVLPLLLLGRLAPAVEKRAHLPSWQPNVFTSFAGVLLMVFGWLLAVWTIFIQFTKAQGTPAPTMATQKLLVQGPYAYCRNPMALGTVLLYLGIGVFIGSPLAAGLVLLFTAVLSLYIKTVEEKELEIRFGSDYTAYKQNTPFLIRIPRWRR